MIVLETASNAFAADQVNSASAQAAHCSQGNGGFYAESVGNPEIKVALSGASFRAGDEGIRAIKDDGVVVDNLSTRLQLNTGAKFDADYEITTPNELVIHYSDTQTTYLPGFWDYTKCVAKGAIGGAVGGCAVGVIVGEGGGCIPGAAAGGIADGVGSLITCA